jgi:eukaryotic-like serine/threonine-protein kinase
MSLPARIGPYEILDQLAVGGMGAIYLARTTGLGGFERHVVLKTLELVDEDHDAEAMFLDEARVLGGLNHHRIAAVHSVERAGEQLFMVLEYVHGRDAFAVWQRTAELGAALPLDFALTVTAAAAAGLHHAHTRRSRDGTPLGIVHRDVSLPNLMIGFDGAVKLIDFGIAKSTHRSSQTQVGFVKGKLGYMAPEQVRGQPVDARTDVFALGIVLYELTTMERAFRVASELETLERIRAGRYTPPSKVVPGYPIELERIVTRALRLAPGERFPDADAFRREVERLGHRGGMVLGDAAVSEVMEQLFEDRDGPLPEGRRPTTGLDLLDLGDEGGRANTAPPGDRRRLRAATEMLEQLGSESEVESEIELDGELDLEDDAAGTVVSPPSSLRLDTEPSAVRVGTESSAKAAPVVSEAAALDSILAEASESLDHALAERGDTPPPRKPAAVPRRSPLPPVEIASSAGARGDAKRRGESIERARSAGALATPLPPAPRWQMPTGRALTLWIVGGLVLVAAIIAVLSMVLGG